MDLAFLVDSSESAKDNHAQEKRFVIDVVDRLQSARLQSGRGLGFRAALLQYSSHVIIERNFSNWRGVEDFKARVAPMAYIGHGTYTTYAITNLTRIYLEESSINSIKLAILLFDGISHPRNPDISAAMADAMNQGIKFFTIGITPEANEAANIAHLSRIAGSSRNVHNLQDAGIVAKVIQEIVSLDISLHVTCQTSSCYHAALQSCALSLCNQQTDTFQNRKSCRDHINPLNTVSLEDSRDDMFWYACSGVHQIAQSR